MTHGKHQHPFVVDRHTVIVPRHQHEPTTSWWLDTRDFYVNAKIRAPFMRSSRLGVVQTPVTSDHEDRSR